MTSFALEFSLDLTAHGLQRRAAVLAATPDRDPAAGPGPRPL